MRALRKRSKSDKIEALDELAEKLLELVEAGDLGALKEFGDRLDGKPGQTIDVQADVTTRPAAALTDDELAAVAIGAQDALGA